MRHCSGERGWRPPELFNCTTASFVQLKAAVGTGVRAGPPEGWASGRPGPYGQTQGVAQGPAPLSPQEPALCLGLRTPSPQGRAPALPSPPFSDASHALASSTWCIFSSCFLARRTLLFCTSYHQSSFVCFLGVSSSFLTRQFPRESGGFLSRKDPRQPHSRFADIAFALSFQKEKLSRNETRMDGAGSLRLAKALRNATQHTATLFGHDLRTAYQLLAHVLQHESGRQGFELAATQDADFHQVRGSRQVASRGAPDVRDKPGAQVPCRGSGDGRSPARLEGSPHPASSRQNRFSSASQADPGAWAFQSRPEGVSRWGLFPLLHLCKQTFPPWFLGWGPRAPMINPASTPFCPTPFT